MEIQFLFTVDENRNTTTIDGMKSGNTVLVSAEDITVSGFTIRNSEQYNRAGVFISANRTIVYKNNIVDNAFGIIAQGNYNNISHNLIDNQQRTDEDTIGIWVRDGDNNAIWRNIIKNNGIGITSDASHTNISYNIISLNEWGMVCRRMENEGGFNEIHYNNFILNRFHASFIWGYGIPSLDITNVANWNQNYWGERLGLSPKPIIGFITFNPYAPTYLIWFNFDWHPAKEPYEWKN